MPGQLAWVAVSSPAELPAETGLPGSGPALIRLGVRLSLTPAAKLSTGRCCMCGGPGAAACVCLGALAVHAAAGQYRLRHG